MEIEMLDDTPSVKKMTLGKNEYLFLKVLPGQERAWSEAIHNAFGDDGSRVVVHTNPAFMTKVEVE